MGVNLSSAVLAWRSREPGFGVAIVFSLAGFIVCLFLWRSLGHTALKAGTIWAILGILLWLVRRKQISSPLSAKLQ
jgi:hypothetical protein